MATTFLNHAEVSGAVGLTRTYLTNRYEPDAASKAISAAKILYAQAMGAPQQKNERTIKNKISANTALYGKYDTKTENYDEPRKSDSTSIRE